MSAVIRHYEKVWRVAGRPRHWPFGPTSELPSDFVVIELPPHEGRDLWTYATACLSQPEDPHPIELHLLSPVPFDGHVELLTAIAHYHRTSSRLGLHDTVNFGRPWLPGSRCDHGLISLPYLDGPALERLPLGEEDLRLLWLIPITPEERAFKKARGVDALEERFESSSFNYADPNRSSVA